MPEAGTEIRREVRIEARPEVVYSFFTDSDKMTRWKGVKAELEPQPGGIYRVDINGRDVASGRFLELEPYRRIVFTCCDPLAVVHCRGSSSHSSPPKRC